MNSAPFMVDWAVSGRCNMSCQHCRGFSQDEVSGEEARRIISEIARLQPGWLIVEGGEPFLRTDIFDLLDHMHKHGLDIHLITNGLLLGKENLDRLRKLNVKVMVSIDGATAATYESIRRGGSFQQVMKSIYEYSSCGLLEALNFTILKTNYTEIPGIFELARECGVAKINLIGYKPYQGNGSELLASTEYREAVRLACQAAQQTGIQFFFDEPFFPAVSGELNLEVSQPRTNAGITVLNFSGCIFGQYLYIEPDGRVKPCSFSPLVVGNVRERSLDEIWQEMLASPLLARIREAENRTGCCRGCPHLSECKGCRSRTFLMTGDWLASDPVCPLIFDKAIMEQR